MCIPIPAHSSPHSRQTVWFGLLQLVPKTCCLFCVRTGIQIRKPYCSSASSQLSPCTLTELCNQYCSLRLALTQTSWHPLKPIATTHNLWDWCVRVHLASHSRSTAFFCSDRPLTAWLRGAERGRGGGCAGRSPLRVGVWDMWSGPLADQLESAVLNGDQPS